MKPDPTPYLSWGAFGITGPKPVTGRVKYGAAMCRSGRVRVGLKLKPNLPIAIPMFYRHPMFYRQGHIWINKNHKKNLNILTKLIVDLFRHALGQHKN